MPCRRDVRRGRARPLHLRATVVRDRHCLPWIDLQFANDSGGRAETAVFIRRTGNSGANPGRPRRCDQACEVGCFEPLRACRRGGRREKACSRPSLEVRRPTRVGSLPDREGGMGDTAAVRPVARRSQDPLLQAPASPQVVHALACACRGGCVRMQCGMAWIRSHGTAGKACRLSNCSSSPPRWRC
jgi:hypothetical protein